LFFHFRNISWSETVIYLVLQLIVMNEFNTNPVLFDLFFDQGKIFNTCLNNMADLLFFSSSICTIESLSYTINGAILCIRGGVNVFTHVFISSENFLFIVVFHFSVCQDYFSRFDIVSVSVCVTKFEQYERNYKTNIYIYLLKQRFRGRLFAL
jgi:hypothetical protein